MANEAAASVSRADGLPMLPPIEAALVGTLLEGEAPDLGAAAAGFRTSIASFRPLPGRDKVTGTSHTLHFIQVPRGATFASLASSVKLPDAENQLRLINGYYPTGEPRTGDWVKVIR